MIRRATPADAEMLARLHVQAWQETYPGLLPPEEIAARDIPFRLRQWRGALAADTSRIRVLPDLSFAQAGPQRDIKLAETYADELYCLYLLRAAQGQGHGRALLASVRRPAAMTALVLAGNTRASRFYAASGARIIDTLPCRVGSTDTTEHVYAWPCP
ncbi:MAG: GNAT family N-acetyltransferase [Pseudomonadota bacterium]